ncbi:MAG: ketopantoate reductase family protein [Candidatus Eremiobacteraeota bacterium]|nr:ketopantoate reductase family protein [Candidatus Eremiobacteraeota bacterium]
MTYAPRELDAVTAVSADLAIVAVKAYDLDAAIASLRRAIPAGGPAILCPLNGVGNEEKLAAAFGSDPIVACALTVPVGKDRDGKGHATHDGGIAFAPVGREAHNWILAAFGQAGLEVKAVGDYRALKWSKLALNNVANASCAILNVLPERLVHFDDVFTLEIRAIREVRAVMLAQRIIPIDLPRYPLRALQAIATLPSPISRVILANRIAGARGRKPPSLLLDLRAGKNKTEVGVLNGAVAEAGHRLGIPTPVNAVFARVLSDIAHMPALWAKYRERPDAIENEYRAEIERGRRVKSLA